MTFTEFINNLAALPLAGVRALAAPPTSLNDADLPVLWVQLPQGEVTPIAFQRGAWWPKMRAQVVVALRPTAQGTQEENFAATLAMMDALANALKQTDVERFSIRAAVVTVAGQDYWAVVTDVEGGER